MENLPIITISLALLGVVGSIVAGRYVLMTERQVTARIVFEKSYFPIFSLIENVFYSEKLSVEEIREYARKILDIFDSADGYFYPSLKHYAEHLLSINTSNKDEEWHSFCWTFDRQYEKVTRSINIPRRSRYYRLNKNQYSDRFHLFRIYFLDPYVIMDVLYFVVVAISLYFVW